MAIWVMENSREGQKTESICSKHDHISRKNSYLEKWISMDKVFLAKSDKSHGNNSLKNRSYDLKIYSYD